MGKKKGQKSDKSPEELEAQWKKKVEHAVTRILEWNETLAKTVSSRKYHLNEDELNLIKTTLMTSFNKTHGRLVPSAMQEIPEKPRFSLESGDARL